MSSNRINAALVKLQGSTSAGVTVVDSSTSGHQHWRQLLGPRDPDYASASGSREEATNTELQQPVTLHHTGRPAQLLPAALSCMEMVAK